MANAQESLFAQFTLLEYLQQSSSARSAAEILRHLHEHTDWGALQLKRQVRDDGLRNLQNWLRTICESTEFGRFIEAEPNPDNRKQLLYRATRPYNNASMAIEEACFLLMAERFLDATLPSDFYDASLQDLFTAARTRLAAYEGSPAPGKRAIRTFLKRIAIAPRGQQLVKQPWPHTVLNEIYRAVLTQRTLKIGYRGENREIHPYAVVIREPKVYLLGVDDKKMTKVSASEAKPVLYLCNRIETARMSRKSSRVPADFDASAYIDDGSLDVRLREQTELSSRAFTLKLRIYSANDNLLRDLEEFPLSDKQSIWPESGTDSVVLHASGMHATFQLVEWILGRMDRVEVLAPLKLRNYVAARIARMHSRYRQ